MHTATKEMGKNEEVIPEFSEDQFEELDRWIGEHRDKSGAVIRALSKAQEIFGYLPREVQARVARGLGMPISEVYGITTFYSFFSIVPRGKHTIASCQGTACYVRGGKQVMLELRRILDVDVVRNFQDNISHFMLQVFMFPLQN